MLPHRSRAVAARSIVVLAVALVTTAATSVVAPADAAQPFAQRAFGGSVLVAASESRQHAKPTRRSSSTVSDFDGDGVDDLAVGARYSEWGFGLPPIQGAVVIRYSSLQRDDFFASAKQKGAADCTDFSTGLATGDFDDDGYDDLAVGDPCESVDGTTTTLASGVVFVFPGSERGLQLSTARRLSRQTTGVPGAVLSGERFGQVLAAGDLNRDGYDDLAIGMPDAKVGSVYRAGKLLVLYGGRSGLNGKGADAVTRSTAGISGAAATGDRFAGSLAIGRVTSDRYPDLVVGVPGSYTRQGALGRPDGAVYLIPGSAAGLAPRSSSRVTGLDLEYLPSNETHPRLGATVVTADVDGDGRDEVVVGEPDASCPYGSVGGGVVVLRAATNRLTTGGARCLSTDSPGVPGDSQYDNFGLALAAADINGDGRDDVAVGAPYRRVNGADYAGAVFVLWGSSKGLTGSRSVMITQASTGVAGAPGRYDCFGTAVAFLDVAGTGRPDLVIGAPDDAATRRYSPDPGSVTVMRNVGGRLKYHSILDGVTAGVTGVFLGTDFGWRLSPQR